MKRNALRLLCGLLVVFFSGVISGCDPDFYLSESEAAAYAGLFSTEQDANSFISSGLPNQSLRIEFDNSSSPPAIRSTNLVQLMRDSTTLGWMEGFNHQIQLDRLNGELQGQVERSIRNQLQLYTGVNNAGVRLTRLDSISVLFLNQPTFTFHPERQSIAFSLSIRLTINGTIEVNALDPVSNLIFGVNGTYPLMVDITELSLSGEAALVSSFGDAGRIDFSLTPQPGLILVSDSGSSSAPGIVKDGVRDTIGQQLSQPLRQSSTQQYNYFALMGLGLTQGTALAPSRLGYTYQPRPEVARPMLHIAARAADGKLYHLRKTEGGQSVIGSVLPFPALQTRIENEPALIASAPDQLELAATTTDGTLVYAHWRDETWLNQATFGPSPFRPRRTAARRGPKSRRPPRTAFQGYTGKPALIASAPGQVEIVAVGRDGGLWHARRFNGAWSAPAAIPNLNIPNVRPAPFRDPVAVLTGNKVTVVFVDGTNHLQAIAYDLEAGMWGEVTLIPTQAFITFAPAVAASGNGRVDVVYVDKIGNPYHRVLEVQSAVFVRNVGQTGISIVGSETPIGGNVTGTPALVCSSLQQLELIARGRDNRLQHNRYFADPASTGRSVDGRTLTAGWQGWGDLNGNFAGTLTRAYCKTLRKTIMKQAM